MTDLQRIEELAGALLMKVSAGDRARLLRKIARDLRASQSARIGRAEQPDGGAYAPRSRRKLVQSEASYPVRFLYPKGAAEPRAVLMKSWRRDGPLLSGFDIEAGAVRSFEWDKVDRWLPVSAEDRARPSGRLRQRGAVRARAMFAKMRRPSSLRAGATPGEAWVGFSGRAAEIGRIHQEGRMDRPSAKAKPVLYPRRELLGVTAAERERMLDLLFAHLSA